MNETPNYNNLHLLNDKTIRGEFGRFQKVESLDKVESVHELVQR